MSDYILHAAIRAMGSVHPWQVLEIGEEIYTPFMLTMSLLSYNKL